MSEREKLVFIFGPTGVGKTELAVRVAHTIGEIISVDSMQVYREMDCGTAKPGARALQAVPHHLIDVVSPDKRFSAGDFRRMALDAIAGIRSRGKIPILVGGTGLYFRALEYKLSEAPKADLKLREQLYAEEEAEKGSLYARLAAIDPETAHRLHPNDLIRIVRALEIFGISGKRPSVFMAGQVESHFQTFKIGLMIDRNNLYERLEKRCLEMVGSGLAVETAALLRRGYNEKLPSMKGLGYSHFIQYCKGCYSFQEVLRLFVRDTRRYAKRQLTWFRKECDVSWYSPEDSDIIRERIEQFSTFREGG
jgi:tRNA dimethylallyltransferase